MQDKKQQNNALVPISEKSMSSILSPCLFNLHAKYITWNARLDEGQAGIKTAGRNTNILRYTDDTTLVAESEEELKSLLMRVKEENEKAGLKLNFQKTKIMATGPITSWQIEGVKVEAVTDFIFLASKITAATKLKELLLEKSKQYVKTQPHLLKTC